MFIRVVYPQEAADVMEIELSLRVWGFRQEGLEQFGGRFFLSPEKLRFHSLSLSADPMGPNRTEEGGLFYLSLALLATLATKHRPSVGADVEAAVRCLPS